MSIFLDEKKATVHPQMATVSSMPAWVCLREILHIVHTHTHTPAGIWGQTVPFFHLRSAPPCSIYTQICKKVHVWRFLLSWHMWCTCRVWFTRLCSSKAWQTQLEVWVFICSCFCHVYVCVWESLIGIQLLACGSAIQIVAFQLSLGSCKGLDIRSQGSTYM